MENPQIEILNILKIDQKIKQKFFGTYFNHENIEKRYLEIEIEIFLKIKFIMHLSYILNVSMKIYKQSYNHIKWVHVFQIISAIIFFFSITIYYVCKDIKKKKIFDQIISYINYIYQIVILSITIIYKENYDAISIIKSTHTLLIISIGEIIFSFESHIFLPFIILIINTILNLVIFIFYNELIKNLGYFLLGVFSIICSIVFKRYMNELNRKNFINRYILKKCCYYYQDIIDKMNGYHLTIRDNKIINFNQNFKLDILNFNNEIDKLVLNHNLNNPKNTNHNNSLSILKKNINITDKDMEIPYINNKSKKNELLCSINKDKDNDELSDKFLKSLVLKNIHNDLEIIFKDFFKDFSFISLYDLCNSKNDF